MTQYPIDFARLVEVMRHKLDTCNHRVAESPDPAERVAHAMVQHWHLGYEAGQRAARADLKQALEGKP